MASTEEQYPLRDYGTANPQYLGVPDDYAHSGQVDVDMEGVASGQEGSGPEASGHQGHYTKNHPNHGRHPSDRSVGGGVRNRNLSTKSQPADQKHLVSRLPSRKLARSVTVAAKSDTWRKKTRKRRPGFSTLRLRQGQTGVDVDQMVENLVHDQDFVDQGRAEQGENIRELPTTLSNKMFIRDQVDKSREVNQRRPGWFKRMRYNVSMTWRRFKDQVAEIRYSLELWRGHLKVLEGNFGTGVTSYFVFLKWLLLFNIPMFLLLFCFVTLPMILYRWFEQEPSGYTGHGSSFSGRDLLTGGGWFENTELYYGYYLNDTIEIIDGHKYDMLYAYLCTMGAFYILSVVILAISVSKSYRKNYIDSSGEIGLYHVTKVFCGWDYSINAPKTAVLRHKSIFKELQEYLSGFHDDEDDRTCSAWCRLLLFRLFTNLVVIGLLAGCSYLLWYISITQSLASDLDFINEMALPLCVSGINFILPIAFSILASFEAYHKPRTELYMTMIRTITLNVVTLGVLVYFWFSSVNCDGEDDDKWLDKETKCYPCWETFLGMEIYKLVVMDFIFILIITFFSEFVRKLMAKFCCPALHYPEFNIARNTLSLIYSQVLVWLGSFYSPLLSFIMILKLLIIFYVKRVSVVQNCVPPVKPWRAGRTHTIILGLLFIAFCFCFGAQAYSLFFMTPSAVCGPYIGYNTSFEIIADLADKYDTSDDVDFFKILLEVITSAAFMAFIVIALCVIAHFSRITATGYEDLVKLLKQQIALEGKDKLFLLRLLQDASRARASHHEALTRRPTLEPSPSTPAQPINTSHQSYNQGYMDRSFDTNQRPDLSRMPSGGVTATEPPQASIGGATAEVVPQGPPGGTLSPESATNPAYKEGSPTNTPNLPYPQQRSLYKT